MIIFQPHQFSDSHYRVEKCTESRFFIEMIRPFCGTCSQKNEVAATNDKDMQAKMHNRLKTRFS